MAPALAPRLLFNPPLPGCPERSGQRKLPKCSASSYLSTLSNSAYNLTKNSSVAGNVARRAIPLRLGLLGSSI